VAEQTFLQPDGAADSPLPDYPGRIKFPLVMTLVMHKAWQRFVNERDPEAQRLGAVFVGDEIDASTRVYLSYDDVELALMFGELHVTTPDGKKITSKTKSDELPLTVAYWIAKAYREWQDSQIMFRWNGAAGVVAQDGPE
jgi:hypothetical protein